MNPQRWLFLSPHDMAKTIEVCSSWLLEQYVIITPAGVRKDNETRTKSWTWDWSVRNRLNTQERVLLLHRLQLSLRRCRLWTHVEDSVVFSHSKRSSGDLYQNQTADVDTAVGRTGHLKVQRAFVKAAHFRQWYSTYTANWLWDMNWRNGKMELR